jgi:DNA-binding response OmpR family regulator
MHPKKKVLVVDGNAINAKILEEFLQGQGYEVSLAFTAQDGLQRVADTNPDVVILDLFLPDMKGSQMCVQLRSHKMTQHIPVILCTEQNISQAEKLKGFQSGVDDYLVRPFELSELLVRIEALLRRASPHFNPEVLAGIDALLKIPQQSKLAPIMEVSAPTLERPVEQKVAMTPLSPPASSLDPAQFNPFRRIAMVLNHPRRAFENTNPYEDLLISLMLILGTPMLMSLTPSSRMDSAPWLAALGIKIMAHLMAWFALAGVLHVSVPFLGQRWSMRHALSSVGLSWAPRALQAVLTAFYAFVAPQLIVRVSRFSGGLDILPGLSTSGTGFLMSEINIFTL